MCRELGGRPAGRETDLPRAAGRQLICSGEKWRGVGGATLLICLATPQKLPCLPQHLGPGYPLLWLCGLWEQLVRGWKERGWVGAG